MVGKEIPVKRFLLTFAEGRKITGDQIETAFRAIYAPPQKGP